MWIKHIILENFASVKVGMHVNRIEIDFSGRKNKICLLLAPNGTGKTSLLSTFTPFATLGNLDVRDSGSLILVGKSGYKEITIIDRGNEYMIKHFYSPNKESHTVKSYIAKNGEELNINGNVRSFQSIVESELGLEIGFLKLIRLGNNVTNLLQLTATERKKFLSNLLQDLDIYLNYFKKLTDDARILKTQISHTTDKLTKTGISDVKEAKKSLAFISDELAELELQKNEALKIHGAIDHELYEYDELDLLARYTEVNKNLKKAKKAMEKLDSTKDLTFYQEKERQRELEIQEREKRLASLQAQSETLLDVIDTLFTEVSSLKKEIEKEENNDNVRSAKEIFHSLRKQKNQEEARFLNYHPAFTKDELLTLMSTLNEIQQSLDTGYEFGEKPVKEVISLMRKQKNVDNYINNGLMEFDSGAGKSSSLLTKLISGVNEISVTCDQNQCDLYRLWKEIKNLMREEEVVRSSHDTEEFYKYMDIVYQRVKRTLELIRSVKEIIEKLPDEQKNDFRTETLFSRIERLKPIYSKESYNVLLTEITEYERYLSLCKECDEAEVRFHTLRSMSNIEFLLSRYDSSMKKLNDRQTEREEINQEIHSIETRLSSLHEEHEQDMDIIMALTKMNEMNNEILEISNRLESYRTLKEKKKENDQRLTEIEDILKKRKQSSNMIQLAIHEYETLHKELDQYMKLFNENTYIKKAMSSKEGIPLEFINIYMSNIQSTINELLDIVYDGTLVIDEFKINSDEFRIPYIKDGYLIPDIVQASQGETAFLSIALSFALISESILHYNIILLDEIDGNLDDKNRKKFISVLERLIDMIDAEQIFLISHNNLFSMYPVDVISLTGEINQDIKLANYIPMKVV